MKVIYEPAGKAREYSELAVNLYTGCSHNCVVCYALQMNRRYGRDPKPIPRKNILELIKKDAIEMEKTHDDRQILLCFMTDPYQEIEDELKITSQTIDVLMQHNLRFTILTKGGLRSIPDMDKYEKYSKASYGVTLNTLNDNTRKKYEPDAACIDDRIQALRNAHEKGIKTWVSVEPVYDANEALYMINEVNSLVDIFKVGKLNHFPEIEKNVDWKRFGTLAVELLERLNKKYYIKEDLRKFIPNVKINNFVINASDKSQKTLFS